MYFYGPGGKLLTTFQITVIAGPTRYTATVQNQQVYFGGMLLGQTGTDYSHDLSTVTDRLGTAAPGYPYGTDVGTAAGADQPDFATYTKEGGSGLEYANQRYYSAGYGRFMTVDPYGGSADAHNPSSWNRYSYVESDPINKRDPSGACSSDDDPPCYPGDGYGFQDSTGGGGGGNSVTPTTVRELPAQWDALSVDCQNALEEALPARSLASGYTAWLGALARANAQRDLLINATQGTNVNWTTLAAIGLRETGFRNVTENDGAGVGVGVFQFTVGSSGTSAAQASDLTWAATEAARRLTSNAAEIAAAEPNITADALAASVVSSWNTGAQGQIRRINAGQTPDFHTAPIGRGPNRSYRNDYGENVRGLADCFQ